MVHVKTRKSREIFTKQDLDDIQQPISKDGWTNPHFDKLYGKDTNPSTGTERDRVNRKSRMTSIPAKDWLRVFGDKNEKHTKDKIKD